MRGDRKHVTAQPNAALLERVRASLAHLPRVEEKRMFGGTTFMVNGKMCVSVGKNRIMCRIDPDLHDRVVTGTDVRTMTMRGRAYRGYVHVDAASVETKRDLDRWLRMALEENARVVPRSPATASRKAMHRSAAR